MHKKSNTSNIVLSLSGVICFPKTYPHAWPCKLTKRDILFSIEETMQIQFILWNRVSFYLREMPNWKVLSFKTTNCTIREASYRSVRQLWLLKREWFSVLMVSYSETEKNNPSNHLNKTPKISKNSTKEEANPQSESILQKQ